MKKNPFSMAVVLAITMFFCELAIFPLAVIFAWLSPLRTGKAMFIAVMLLLFVITAGLTALFKKFFGFKCVCCMVLFAVLTILLAVFRAHCKTRDRDITAE